MSDSTEQKGVSQHDTLREIDWLSIAPWLMLTRVPGAALFSSSLLLAVAGVLLAEGISMTPTAAPTDVCGLANAAVEGATSLPRLFAVPLLAPFCQANGSCKTCDGSCDLGLWQLLVWSFFGLAIAERAARILTYGPASDLKQAMMLAGRRWLRLAGSLCLAIIPLSLLLYLLPKIAYGGLASDYGVLAVPVAILWGLVLLISFLGAVLVIGIGVGLPFLWAAIAVDHADPFDAVSRMLAYTFQRIPRLVFYVAIAAAGGVATGILVELLTSATLSVTDLAFPAGQNDIGKTALSIVTWWETIFVKAMRAFYPAYFFTAIVAIYLLLRQDIDGQPTDEMLP